jgi:hypothetical protein
VLSWEQEYGKEGARLSAADATGWPSEVNKKKVRLKLGSITPGDG